MVIVVLHLCILCLLRDLSSWIVIVKRIAGLLNRLFKLWRVDCEGNLGLLSYFFMVILEFRLFSFGITFPYKYI